MVPAHLKQPAELSLNLNQENSAQAAVTGKASMAPSQVSHLSQTYEQDSLDQLWLDLNKQDDELITDPKCKVID